jgi:hypothetical protein
MAMESLDMEGLTNVRRKALEESIHAISLDEMKSLGEMLFPFTDNPFRERYFQFLAENPGSTFYHASTKERLHILYCPEKERGMWFLAGSGMGPLQAKGLQMMKEIVAGA